MFTFLSASSWRLKTCALYPERCVSTCLCCLSAAIELMDNIFLRTSHCASRAGLFPKHENPKAITSKSSYLVFLLQNAPALPFRWKFSFFCGTTTVRGCPSILGTDRVDSEVFFFFFAMKFLPLSQIHDDLVSSINI